MNAKHLYFQNTMLDLVSKNGFKATTMRDLAQAMKCDVSNIYNYINSKQAFLEKILFQINDAFQERIDQITSSDLSPIDQLKQVVRLYVELSTNRPLELSLLNNEWRNLKNDKKAKFINERKKFESKVTEIIVKGIQSKTIKKMDINLITHLFLSSIRLLFNRQSAGTETINQIELERQINEYIFDGICI